MCNPQGRYISKPWLDVISKADLLPPLLWPDNGGVESPSHGTHMADEDQQLGRSCDGNQSPDKIRADELASPAGARTGALASGDRFPDHCTNLPEAPSGVAGGRLHAANPAEDTLSGSALPPPSPSRTEGHVSGQVEVVGGALRSQDRESSQVAESPRPGTARVSPELGEGQSSGAQGVCGGPHGDPERVPEREPRTWENGDAAGVPGLLSTGMVSNDGSGVTKCDLLDAEERQYRGTSKLHSPSGDPVLAGDPGSAALVQGEGTGAGAQGPGDVAASIRTAGDPVPGGAPDLEEQRRDALAEASALTGDAHGSREGLPSVPRGPADLLRLLPDAVLVSSKTERGITSLKRRVLLMFSADAG